MAFLDDLAELGARTVRAPRGVIFKRELATDAVSVVGRYGTLFEPSPKFPVPNLMVNGVNIVSIPDIRADARFAGHPLLDYVPRINSLIIANISPNLNYQARYRFTLIVSNAAPEAFVEGELFCALTHVINVCRQFVSAIGHEEAYLAESSSVPLPAYILPASGALPSRRRSNEEFEAANYLFDTLPRKHVLHESAEGGFISLRRWGKSIKAKQIEALTTALANPSDEFLDPIADEYVSSIQRLFGADRIRNVVPLPSDGTEDRLNLRTLLSARIARKLKAKTVRALEFESVKAQPENKKLNPYKLAQQVEGGVLLLDDIAKSTRNLEFAQHAVKRSGSHCYAMSWIGP